MRVPSVVDLIVLVRKSKLSIKHHARRSPVPYVRTKFSIEVLNVKVGVKKAIILLLSLAHIKVLT